MTEVEWAEKNGHANEDSFVELKRVLPDAKKAARQIAALCNAARGQEAIWIIGVDEKTGVIHGAESTDLEAWWPGVVKSFDEVAPSMVDLKVATGDGKVVKALFFETDRAPYVVKTESGGPVGAEVPWRAGNGTRSAHRNELLKILQPAVSVPRIEVLYGSFEATAREAAAGNAYFSAPGELFIELGFTIILYLEPTVPITLPDHRQEVVFTADSKRFTHTGGITNQGPGASNDLMQVAHHSVRIIHPTQIVYREIATVRGESSDLTAFASADKLDFEVILRISGSDQTGRKSREAGKIQVLDKDHPQQDTGSPIVGYTKWEYRRPMASRDMVSV